MNASQALPIEHLDLAGVRYAVLPLEELQRLAERAGVRLVSTRERPGPPAAVLRSSPAPFSQRLAARRSQAGLTQKSLALRAGVRVETLNRLERGRSNPDFVTVRKLMDALRAAERGAPHPVPPAGAV